jgi:hypothetical protein
VRKYLYENSSYIGPNIKNAYNILLLILTTLVVSIKASDFVNKTITVEIIMITKVAFIRL